jgi:hypothetical protein
VSRAVDAGQGSPAGLDPGTGITWDTARPGNQQMMANILAGNPQTAPMVMQNQMQEMANARALERQIAAAKAGKQLDLEYNPQIAGAMTPVEVAKAQAMVPVAAQQAGAVSQAQLPAQMTLQDRNFGQQQTLQGNQQNFTAGQNALTREQQAALQANQQQFTAGENALNRDLQTNLKMAETKLATAKSGGEPENQLRDEFNTLTKDFRTVTDAYTKIKNNSPTGAGDMSLLYNYVKLLDPGSVVRESEFATAASSGSYGERIQGLVQRVLTGERLPATLRADFIKEADKIYEGQKQGADRLKDGYEKLADKYGVDKSRVIVDYSRPQEPAAPPTVFKFDAQGNPIK